MHITRTGSGPPPTTRPATNRCGCCACKVANPVRRISSGSDFRTCFRAAARRSTPPTSKRCTWCWRARSSFRTARRKQPSAAGIPAGSRRARRGGSATGRTGRPRSCSRCRWPRWSQRRPLPATEQEPTRPCRHRKGTDRMSATLIKDAVVLTMRGGSRRRHPGRHPRTGSDHRSRRRFPDGRGRRGGRGRSSFHRHAGPHQRSHAHLADGAEIGGVELDLS